MLSEMIVDSNMVSKAVVSTTMSKTTMNIDGITILENESMAAHTSWRAGGFAKHYVKAESLTALAKYISSLPKDEKIIWLGLGSNTLVRDGGFDGTVIATQGAMTQLELIEENRVYVGAGVSDAKLARFCKKHELLGAGFFAGIPGLVGGALAMNAGAFGGETWPLIESVETLNRKGEITKRDATEFDYSYRKVEGLKDEWFVSATLKLEKAESGVDKRQGTKNTVDIKQYLEKRAATQPTGVASCGSVFRNPQGQYAAQLIEDCGLKGTRIGGAVISQKHANFIINDNKASAADIESLIELIQKAVREQKGVELKTEVKIVGSRIAVAEDEPTGVNQQ